MYYEEKLIDGVLCYRITPDGDWDQYDLKELSRRYVNLQQEFREYRFAVSEVK